MAQSRTHITPIDPVWHRIVNGAEDAIRDEPL